LFNRVFTVLKVYRLVVDYGLYWLLVELIKSWVDQDSIW